MPRPNPSLLESKFQPQLGPRTQVNRMRLAVPEALLQGSVRAVSVVAPTGYGKTTLMAQWHGTLSSVQPARVDVAWLNLDENDNDPPRLLRYLYAALGRCVPTLASNAVPEISRTTNLSVILEDLSLRLAAHGRPVVLFLDDLHVISDGEAARTLEWLLRYAGTHLRFVVGSRQALGGSQAELRLRGQLIEVASGDPRLVPQEPPPPAARQARRLLACRLRQCPGRLCQDHLSRRQPRPGVALDAGGPAARTHRARPAGAEPAAGHAPRAVSLASRHLKVTVKKSPPGRRPTFKPCAGAP